MRRVSFAANVTLAFLLLACAAQAAEIKVMSSAGFAPAYRELSADFDPNALHAGRVPDLPVKRKTPTKWKIRLATAALGF